MLRLILVLLLGLTCCSTTQSRAQSPQVKSRIATLDFKEDCAQLYYLGRGMAQTGGYRKQGYDTLKHFVRTHSPGLSGPPDYSAVNSIIGNNTDGSSGQIQLMASSDPVPRLQLGQNVSWWTDYAENNIQQGVVSSSVLIKGALSSGNPVKVGLISPNYWGGITPTSTHLPDVDFSTPIPGSNAFTYSNVSCGDIPTKTKGKGDTKANASMPFDFADDCLQLYYLGAGYAQSAGFRKEGYETLKQFVETCAPGGKFGAWSAFPDMNGAVQYMGGSFSRYIEYREWLKSVLYLDQIHPDYYCSAVESITFTYHRDGSASDNVNAQLAIIKYLLESGKCEMDSGLLGRGYSERREMQYKLWADTTTVDTNLVKMDTTLPTLEDLDLEILRGPEFASINSDPSSPSLLGVRVLNNPFSTSTEIEYTLGRTAQVELAIYNALGQQVWTKPFGAVEDARMHRLSIGDDLVPGSYFLRVATMDGAVKTVSLIKQ